jgi:protein-tyrosine phosphatase
MVCLGNICRSPMADGLLRNKINEKSLPWQVDSAGTADYHVGEAPDKRMQATALKYGVDISSLRARQFKQEDFDTFDLIYAMDQNNYNAMHALARTTHDRKKIRLILDELSEIADKNVPDPYYGSTQDFIDVFLLLDRACDQLIQRLIYYENR